MRVFRSRLLARLPGIAHATAPHTVGPLTFSGHPLASVRSARSTIVQLVGGSLDQLTLGRQVHGSRIRIITRDDVGAGSQTPVSYLPATDGLLTQRPDVILGIFTADCIPVLLADPVSGWIGALHVGWRGMVTGIIPRALRLLKSQGVSLYDVRVWAGPSICAQHYTTADPKHAKRMQKHLGVQAVQRRGSQFHVDLWAGVRQQLLRAGVRQQQIEKSTTCTYETRELPSARRDGPTHANTLTVITRHAEPHDLRGRDVTLLGIGAQGGGAGMLRYAAKHAAHVLALDQQPRKAFTEMLKQRWAKSVHFAFGRHASTYTPTDVLICNPAIPPNHPYVRQAKRQGVLITNDIAIYRSATKNSLIGITGTKGKTTVASWLAFALKQAKVPAVLVGNVRRSPFDEPAAFDGKTLVVLELSSFQLEGCDVPLRLRAAVVTNLFPDHLNRHRSMREYARVKVKLFSGQGSHDLAVLPLDSDWLKFKGKPHGAHVLMTNGAANRKADVWSNTTHLYYRKAKRTVPLLPIAQIQKHDAATIRCAVTVAATCLGLGFPVSAIRRSLRTFPGVPERNEVIRKYRGRIFIDNTTATNPIAAALGIASVSGPCVCIAGGADKALPLQPLITALQKTKYVVLLHGTATTRLRRRLRVPYVVVRSMPAAVRAAWRASAIGDTVLLSPGAASFGMFKNEFDRGAQFQAAVRKLR